MIIGIDASRAFIKNRTGIEEYSYQVIKHLANELNECEVVLYVRDGQQSTVNSQQFPTNWRAKVIKWPYLWTQIGLSLEMLLRPVDVLFIPAHTVPIIHPARNASLFSLALSIQKLLKIFGVSTHYNKHGDAGGPKNTIVTIHGLEYEFCPEAYSFWERIYMRFSIKNSCKWAKKIIAVSENTKKDLMNLYKVPEEKIKVIYEGYAADANFQFPISNFQSIFNNKISKPYLLFIGRIEVRKNIEGILEAYKILVEKYKIPHTLVLAGSLGYGYDIIKLKIQNYLKIKNSKLKIIELGYINEAQKWQLLSNAEAFVFPSFYEGFGLPHLRNQLLL
jgi:glycosyltransferase involved in cell wall biosynthesis